MPAKLRSRPGSVTIAVLGVSVLVTIMGVGGLVAAHAQRRHVESSLQARRSQALARSAIELGRTAIASDPNWRANTKHNQWSDPLTLDGGTLRWKVLDESDGDLTNNSIDSIRLFGLGSSGQATQVASVQFSTARTSYTSLGCALHAAGQVTVRSGAAVTALQSTVSSNGTISNSGTIYGSTDSLLYAGLGVVTGTKTVAALSKPFPPSSVITDYTARATPIAPGGTLEKVVLSPTSNPFGAVNPNGVYVINPSSNLTIRDVRVSGTLIINCPGKKVTIDRAVLFQPANRNFPTLIVNGDLQLAGTASTPLLESAVATNFNPPAAPYGGASDSDTADSYPNELQGLVHVTGSLEVSGSARIRGLVLVQSASLVGAVDVSGSLEIVYDKSLASAPPEGYASSISLVVAPASWRREPAP
ncbi:MAG: hypothetical protein JNJ48_04585 [Phycisphaerae bacterium]|nr:hypothetical protein [Phycisphaerae bacterium]